MQLAVREKQQRGDGCSLLQNYRIGSKIPSAALNLSWLCALFTYLSAESLQRLLMNTTMLPRKPQKLQALKHAALSQELLLLNRNCLIHSALSLVPISAPHAAQRERWGQRKKKKESVFTWKFILKYNHIEPFSWNGIKDDVEPAPSPQLSMVKPEVPTRHFPHVHSLHSTMTSSCPVNCILHYAEWLYPML